MANDRIRLSDKARKRLFSLAEQADIEPSFLLEYLINRHGNESIQLLTGSLVTQTNTNQPTESDLLPVSVTNDPSTTPKTESAIDKIKSLSFD
jgi:hypothetical protein